MAGLSTEISAQMVQSALGHMAQDVHVALKRAQDGVEFLAGVDDADLLTLYQINANDAALLRAAYTELDLLYGIYRGNQTLPAARNFRNPIRRIIGLGFR